MNLWYALPYLLVLDFTSNFRLYEYYYINCSYSALSLVSTCLLSYHALSTVGLYVLGLWWHEIRVYRWGFPCLDYSFDVLVSWSRDLKPYNQICSSSALFGFTAIHVLTPARHLAFVSPLAWGVSADSPGSSCPGHGAWSVWILPVADQSSATVAWIPSRPSGALSFQAPLCASRVSFSKLVSAFILFMLVHCLVFPQLRISVM